MNLKFIEELRRIQKPKEVGHVWNRVFLQYFKEISKKDSLILKTDLWNEVIATNKSLAKSLQIIKPKKIIYIEKEKELCRIFLQNRKKSKIIINGDIIKIPLKEESLDIIVDISTSDHLPLYKFKKVIQEYWRVLKKDGNLVLFHFNKDYFNVKRQRKIEEKILPSFPRNDDEITNIIKKAGFRILKKKFLIYCLDETFIGSVVLFFLKLFKFSKVYDIIAYGLNFKPLSLQIGYLCVKS